MMMLLPLVAMMAGASAVSDTARYECRVERKMPHAGALVASRLFPVDFNGETTVYQSWQYKQRQLSLEVHWRSSLPDVPDDDVRLQIVLSNISKYALKARIELWRDGKRISDRWGAWDDFKGRSYRNLDFHLLLGDVRELLKAGPIQIVAVDGDGRMIEHVTLLPALIQQVGLLAQSARDEFQTLAADYARLCPYDPPALVI
jgi:hypothetical protein